MRCRLARLTAFGRVCPVALVAVLAVAGCGGGKSGKSSTKKGATATTGTTSTAATPETTAAGCTKVDEPSPKGPQHLKKPTTTLAAAKTWTVKLQTNCGEIDIRLDVRRAPKTTSSVAALVRGGFYDGLIFHRVVPDFVVQGGDPLGNGNGGPGYSVVERPPASLTYRRGVVAMAKAQVDPPGSSGSQFFIVTAPDAGLPAIYALVGKVVGSFKAVDRISATPTNASQRPQDAVVIQKATLTSG
jgi:peptidyl-prolyl cis-trans isomerase B (cyclophilin B)